MTFETMENNTVVTDLGWMSEVCRFKQMRGQS